MVEAEGAADRDDPVADFERLAVAETSRDEIGGLDLDHRQVRGPVRTDDGGGDFTAIVQHDLEFIGTTDDVVVGHDHAGLVDDHAGAFAHAWRHAATALLRGLGRTRHVGEEAAELFRHLGHLLPALAGAGLGAVGSLVDRDDAHDARIELSGGGAEGV